jgi:hypothetical protein
VFFFEKKNQKTLTYCVRFRRDRDSNTKGFLLLFFKKEGLPSPRRDPARQIIACPSAAE